MNGILSRMNPAGCATRSCVEALRTLAQTANTFRKRALAPVGLASAVAGILSWTSPAMAAPPTTPAGLRAVTGGDSIAVIWSASSADTAINHYNVYRDGAKIASTTPGSRPGKVYLQGTRFTDQNIALGGTYTYQVQAVDGNNAVSGLSDPLQVSMPSQTTPVPQITVDTSATPDLTNWANNVVVPELQVWYPKIADLIDFPYSTPTSSFTIVFDPNAQGVASTDAAKGIITVSAAYARQNPDDLGMFIHESTHIIQNAIHYSRGWIVEGMADWAREFPYHDRDPVVPLPTDSYIEGYSMGSYLLNWAEVHYGNGTLIRSLTDAFHYDRYSDTAQFPIVTHHTPDQAWAEMTGVALVTGSITNAGSPGKCVDNYQFDQSDGNPIVSWECTGTDNQLWSAVPNTDNTMALRVHGKCLDVTSSGTANGTLVQLYTCNNSAAQKWVVNGGALVNPNSGRCLDGGDLTDAQRLQIADCSGSVAQQWHIGTPISVGRINLGGGVIEAGTCVSNSGGVSSDGNPIVISPCVSGSDAQRWLLVPNIDPTFGLMVQRKCMDTAGGGTANGTPIQLSPCNGSIGQRWIAARVSIHPITFVVYLKNAQTGRCAAVNHDGPSGSQLQLWDCDSTHDVGWTLPN